MQIEMTIKGLMVDPISNMPIVILRDKDGQKTLPIWVGMFEANAIALQLENVATPRTFNKHPCERWEFWEWWPTRNDVPFNGMWAVNEADRGHLTPGRPKAWRLANSAAPVKSDR